jgi:hypothetical protein
MIYRIFQTYYGDHEKRFPLTRVDFQLQRKYFVKVLALSVATVTWSH